MKYGFSLPELLIGITISSLLVAMTLGVFSTLTRTSRTVNFKIDYDIQSTLAYTRIQEDIIGACIPVQVAIQNMQKKEAQKAKQAQQEQNNGFENSTESASQIPPLDHIFVVETSNKQLNTLTCITNCPARVYWNNRLGKPRPMLARVIYRLEKEENSDGTSSYALYRQEGSDLSFDAYDPGSTQNRNHKILSNITSCTVVIKTLKVPEKKPNTSDRQTPESQESSVASADNKSEEKPQEREIIEFDSWNSDASEEDEPEQHNALPYQIIFTIKAGLTNAQRDTEQTLVINIASADAMSNVNDSPGTTPTNSDSAQSKPEETQQSPQASVPMPQLTPTMPAIPQVGLQNESPIVPEPQSQSKVVHIRLVTIPEQGAS